MESKSPDFVYFDDLNALFSADGKLKNPKSSLYKLENFTRQSDRPRTLLCHDHRGGYLDYESTSGSLVNIDVEQAIPFYAFLHWWHIDIFIYFSHHFITIPPPTWIKQAHQHGVLILGTFIIENEQLCREVFADRKTIDRLIERMVECCTGSGFDGWLINIETKMKTGELENQCILEDDLESNQLDRPSCSELDNLEYFLSHLSEKTHVDVHKHAQIIWYDSVTSDGELKWQNALNQHNVRWFRKVDGFYTNYAWKEKHLQQTLNTFFTALSQNILKNKSIADIYIGIDVFGRGCLGGGRWNCIHPLELIRHHSLSAAIFAPGWICEHFPNSDQQCLFDNTFCFWNPLKSLLFPHRLTQRSIDTQFNVGFSSEHLDFCNQKKEKDNHFCMENAGLQPFYLCSTTFCKDLDPGFKVVRYGIHDLFLCAIPIKQTDEHIDIIIVCSPPAPIDVVVTLSKGTESLQLCQPVDDGDSGCKNLTATEMESQKRSEFDVRERRGWTISKISLWNKRDMPARIFGMMLLSIPAGLPISQDHPHHLPLSLSSELLVLMFLSSCSCSVHASHNFFDRPDPSAQRMPPAHHQQLHSLGFVHTFETSEQCESNCPRPCVQQILEELEMMPRWVCDPQNFEQPARPPKVHPRNLGSSSPLDGSDQQSGLLALVHNQLLLIIVPAAFFAILCIIILLRRCTSSASMATI